jgi:hypothetical protein
VRSSGGHGQNIALLNQAKQAVARGHRELALCLPAFSTKALAAAAWTSS